ncbi:MAG: purine/pyrimidine permease [Alphaproteobacteria bacterium]|nr:purine/pyrimidine permease [Alphaproteobacteria bacterium]
MSADPDHSGELLYGIEDIPPPAESLMLGLQHYLTMFGATLAIPLILSEPLGVSGDPVALSWIIGTIFFVSGLATLLQSTFGTRLPIIQGGSFSFLGPAIAICFLPGVKDLGWEVKMQHIQGAIILGALVQTAIGYSGLMGALLRFVGPITIAPTIALIGISLFGIGFSKVASGPLVGGATVVAIILFSQYLRNKSRVFQLYPVLLGIGVGWGLAALGTSAGWFGAEHAAHVNVDQVRTAPWIRVPLPFQWGLPQFGVAATVGMFAGFLAGMIESIGDYFAAARLSGAPMPDAKTVNRGIGMEGIGCLIAGIFGTGNATTSYSENIGAIGLTRVGSRRVVQVGAGLMIGLGVIAKFGALFTTIPDPVVGAMYCVLFGMIASVGLSNLQFVDLNSGRNLFILGFAFYMGLSVPAYMGGVELAWGDLQWLADIVKALGSSGMAVGAVIALVLDNTIPGTDEERGLAAWKVA